MATYTGVADANGDFIVPFPLTYTGGQKITVTAEKEGAEKSIELFAPSSVITPPAATDLGMKFSGTMVNFPLNIGVVTFFGVTGTIQKYSMGSVLQSGSNYYGLGNFATGLVLNEGVEIIDSSAFQNWVKIKTLNLPSTLKRIGDRSFAGCVSLTSLTIPASVVNMEDYAFYNLTACDQVIVLATAPPSITALTFSGLKSTCIFKVPAASVAVYQTAPNWSVFAARIQAI